MPAVSTSKPSISVPNFVQAVEKSQLVDVQKLRRVLKSVSLTTTAQKRTAKDVAEQLVVAGLITSWQARQLLKGKHRGFFLGKYVIRKPLGKGGMGIVYEAEHSVLNTRVAIKILPEARNAAEHSVSRFLAEARAAAKLTHPNLVRVHDCDVVDNRRFMVMDLVEGSDLGTLVEQNGPLSYRNAIQLLRQAAAGLGYAHENGVTHRDVKPNNFLVDQRGELRVADMGLAKFDIDTPERHTRDGNAILGTVDYVAPEQAWDSRKVDRRADIYSLGCTLYFMITGKPPFGRGTLAQRLAMHQTAQPKPLTQIRPDCPTAIWALCQKMMAKKPQDRFQRMDDIVRVCDQMIPKLSEAAPNAESLAQLAADHSPEDSYGSGSNEIPALSFDGTQANVGLPDLSDMSNLGTPLTETLSNAGELTQPGSSPQNGYWGQSAGTSGGAPKTSKQESRDAQTNITLYIGLGVAFLALGTVIFVAITILSGANDNQDGVFIKAVENKDGDMIIFKKDKD